MDQAPQQARLDAILAGEEPDNIRATSAFGNIARGVPIGGPTQQNSRGALQLPGVVPSQSGGGGGTGWQASTLGRNMGF
eukprot:5897285-Amphidinium_carterae.1